MKFTVDPTFEYRKALGFIVLQNDATLEGEISRMLNGSDVPWHVARISSEAKVTKETLLMMEERLPVAAKLLPPMLNLSAIGFACTSGATVIGTEKVAKLIHTTHHEMPVTNPLDSVIEGCRRLGIKKPGMLTPYIEEVSNAIRDLLGKHGIHVRKTLSFGEAFEERVVRISEESVLAAILQLAEDKEVDGFFASCTNLHTFGILAKAEELTGKPMLSSNQALIWNMLRLSGNEFRPKGFGQLAATTGN